MIFQKVTKILLTIYHIKILIIETLKLLKNIKIIISYKHLKFQFLKILKKHDHQKTNYPISPQIVGTITKFIAFRIVPGRANSKNTSVKKSENQSASSILQKNQSIHNKYYRTSKHYFFNFFNIVCIVFLNKKTVCSVYFFNKKMESPEAITYAQNPMSTNHSILYPPPLHLHQTSSLDMYLHSTRNQ